MNRLYYILFYCLLVVKISAQNTGIGTSTPGTMLDVNGAITTRETTITITNNIGAVPANTSLLRIAGTATSLITLTAATPPNAGQRLVIYNNTSGGFGVMFYGSVIQNGALLEFTYSNGSYVSLDNGVSKSGWRIKGNDLLEAGSFLGTTDATSLRFRTNGTDRMLITPTGKIGIGTPTPEANLSVEGNLLSTDSVSSLSNIYARTGVQADNNVVVDADGSNTGNITSGALRFGGAGSTSGIASKRNLGTNQNSLDFYTQGRYGLSITNAGNVLAGTANPLYNSRLTVVGDVAMANNGIAAVFGTTKVDYNILATGNVKQPTNYFTTSLPTSGGSFTYTYNLSLPTGTILMLSIEKMGGSAQKLLTYYYVDNSAQNYHIVVHKPDGNYFNTADVKVHWSIMGVE